MTDPTPNSPTLSGRMVEGSLWTSIGAVVSIVFGVLGTILLARLLGVVEFGRFAVGSVTAALVLGFSDLGLTQALIRRGALQLGGGMVEEGLEFQAVSWFMLRVPFMAAAFAVITQSKVWVVAVYVVAILIQASFQGAATRLVIRADFSALSRNRLLQTIGGLTGAVGGAAVDGSGYGACVISLLCLNLPGLFLFDKTSIGVAGMLRPRVPKLTPTEVKFGAGMFLAGQLSALTTSRTEVFFFGSNQARQRGVYSAQQTVAARITLAIDALFGPAASGLLNARGTGEDRFERAAGIVLRSSSYLMAAASAPCMVAGALIAMPIFGSGFQGYPNALLLLLFVSLIGTTTQPIVAIWVALGRSNLLLIASVISLSVNLAASALLVHRYGMWGAAWANSVGGVLLSVCLAVPLWRQPSFGNHVLRMQFLTTVSASAGAAMVIFASALPWGPALRPLLVLPLAIVAGLAIARTFVPIDDSELRLILSGRLGFVLPVARLLTRPCPT